MCYRYFLILILILMLGSTSAQAQEPRYRVEILVLTLLVPEEEAQERLELPDYSAATDFLTPPAPDAAAGEAVAPEEEPLTEGVDANEGLTAAGTSNETDPAIEPAQDPNRLVHIEEMSGTMQEAWRRLRLSGPYRPEQFLSWEQGNRAPFPVLRIHDLDPVMVDDPWESHRQKPGENGTVFGDAAGMDALQAALEFEGPALPSAVFYYRLDGTVSLRRSRFLHLDLDIQLREPLWETAEPATQAANNLDNQPAQPAAFRVHGLKQSRQVRSGRIEYFDGPVLGVLALITVVEGESGEAP